MPEAKHGMSAEAVARAAVAIAATAEARLKGRRWLPRLVAFITAKAAATSASGGALRPVRSPVP